MLFIAILSFLASISYRKELVKRGHTSSRLWLLPALIGVVIIIVSHYVGSILIEMAIQHGSWPGVASFIISAGAIVIYLGFIARYWKKIQNLDPVKTTEESLKSEN